MTEPKKVHVLLYVSAVFGENKWGTDDYIVINRLTVVDKYASLKTGEAAFE